MGTEFTPIFLFVLIAIFTAASMLILSAILGPRKTTAVKQMPYESGMDPIGDARQRFDVRYYLVAIVFLLFDVELLFLYPWAVANYGGDVAAANEPKNVPAASAPNDAASAAPAASVALPSKVYPGIPAVFRGLVFAEILVFILVLAAAFAYAWRKGVFEWR